MLEYLTNKFKESNEMGDNIYVNIFQDGYLVVDGNRMAKINLDGSVEMFEKNMYTLSTNEEWTFTENSDGTATLIAYNKELKGKITIPTEVKNKETNNVYTVTALGNNIFNYASNITNVNMSGAVGLKTIGVQAFANCTNLKINIPSDLPSSIENLKSNAFFNCTNLVGNIDEILDSKIILGRGTFANCPKLTGSIQNVFNQMFYIQEDGKPNQTTITEGQFSGFSGLTGALIIPNYITEIGKNAFSNCSGITSLSFEDGSACTKIGDNAFYQTTEMTNSLTLPNSIIQIGARTFYQSGIIGIKLPANLQTIGEQAFYQSKISGTLTIPKTLKEVFRETFYQVNINTLNFETDGSNGTQVIGDSAFMYNTNLEKINLPSTLTTIERWGFLGDELITNISLPDNLANIGVRVFENCKKINISHWPTKLTTIGEQAFKKCEALINLPDNTSLISIGPECFVDCISLGKTTNDDSTDIILYLQNSKITNVGSGSFKNCTYLNGNNTGEIKNKNNAKIAVGGSAFVGTGVIRSAELKITGTTINANAYNGVTEFKQNGNVITQITIPNGVTNIGASAFAGCTSITSVIIPNTVTSIGTNAFQNCTNLQTVTFESENTGLTGIPNYCFEGCNKLNSIQNIPKNITIFGNYSFHDCKKLETLVLPEKMEKLCDYAFWGSGLTNIKLPENLTLIGQSCFRTTQITKIEVPDSVTSIGTSIFEGSKVQEVTIGKGITKTSSYLFHLCSNLTKVTFRGKITALSSYTFNGCSKLQLSGINGLDWKELTYIDAYAFRNCTSLNGRVQLLGGCNVDSTALTNCALTFYK